MQTLVQLVPTQVMSLLQAGFKLDLSAVVM